MAERQPLPEPVAPGFVLWLTGLPASGKTTLALELRRRLAARGIAAVIIDSDELRKILTPAPAYSREERDEFYLKLAQLAQWLSESGVNVLIAATAIRRAYRDAARQAIPRFAEIHVKCDIEICRQRDPKGLYARAAANEIKTMPAAESDFEASLNPEVTVDTNHSTITQAADEILAKLSAFIGKT
jgi:adenylylsulfate kinase